MDNRPITSSQEHFLFKSVFNVDFGSGLLKIGAKCSFNGNVLSFSLDVGGFSRRWCKLPYVP